MIPQFAVWSDNEGNLYMGAGQVICRAGTTTTFAVGIGGIALEVPVSGGFFQAVEGPGADFAGGAGNNVKVDAPELGTMAPYGGLMRAAGPDEWRPAWGNQEFALTFNPGDGSAELSDGTDVLATMSAGAATVAPYGTMTATTHGEDTYNGGTGFSLTLTYEGAPQAWPVAAAYATADGSGIEEGSYTRTDWQAWESADDPLWTMTLDGTGAGALDDGTDVVATRAADAALLLNPRGTWQSTTYGAATYGPAADVATGTPGAGTFPTQGYLLADTTDGVETWLGITDGDLYITLDTATGDALLMDADDVVAERLGGSTSTPDGSFTATAYGIATYHSGAWSLTLATAAAGQPFEVQVGLSRAVPADGVVYVELTLDGSNEVTAVAGPIFAASLPANTATEHYEPVAGVSGGVITAYQFGPIHWTP